MNTTRMAMSRPLNVPIGGRSMRTRRKYASAPMLITITQTRVTQSSVSDPCRMEIGSEGAGMSRSNECGRRGERGFVQIAAADPERDRLGVVHDPQAYVQPGCQEVP